MRILIVDDEMSALYVFLQEIMYERNVNYKFFQDNEKEIIGYVSHNRIDAAFLDIRMPNIDGFELARKLIEIRPDIKIVFITGLSVTHKDLDETLAQNTLGFIYKPYDKHELLNYLNTIAEGTPLLTVKTFDTFECFINERRIVFSSLKSKELFALLIVYNGKGLSMTDAISHLWPDHDLEKAKKLYRDAVWRLRKTLKSYLFECVVFLRAELALKKENISCDYWDFIERKNNDYHGEFLKNYDWSIEYLSYLDNLSNFNG